MGVALQGSSGNDTLTGTETSDTLIGLAGADRLDGADGSDVLASDQIGTTTNGAHIAANPRADLDTILGGGGDDMIFAGYSDTVDGMFLQLKIEPMQAAFLEVNAAIGMEVIAFAKRERAVATA